MGVTTLFSDGESWIASTRLVYRAPERDALVSVAEQAARLEALVASRETALAEALEAARREGLERGRREGLERGAAELGATLAELRAADVAERERQRAALVELALGVVRRVVGEIAPAERLAALARVAAAELLDEPRLVLHVHPTRCRALRARLGLAPAEGDGSPDDAPENGSGRGAVHGVADGAARGAARGVARGTAHDVDGAAARGRTGGALFDDVIADAALERDGAVIETAGGRIAIDLDTQLAALGEQLDAARDVPGLVDGAAP